MEWVPIFYLDRQVGPTDWRWHEWTVIYNPRYRMDLFAGEFISILDGLGENSRCLNEDVKYGWLTAYYQRLSTLGGFQDRHFLAGGFNGDWLPSGASGRSDWFARHWVPAMLYGIGDPISEVYEIDAGTSHFSGADWTWRVYQANFENGIVLHFPNYLRDEGFDAPPFDTSPPYVYTSNEPFDILQYDGSWLANQIQVSIPAGSGRIIKFND